MTDLFFPQARILLGLPPLVKGAADPVEVRDKRDLKRAVQVVDINPTIRQKITENYRKAHIRINGLNITIENPKGSIRSKESPDNQQVLWANKMPAHYGYIKGTVGADYDQVDCFIGKHHNSPVIYIIDQRHHKTNKYDESKCMIWFKSMQNAIKCYDKAFADGSGPERRMGVAAMDFNNFKAWLKTNGTIRPSSKGKTLSQNEANYYAPSQKNHHCGDCSMFVHCRNSFDINQCTLVEGNISYYGICDYFDKA